MRSSSDRNNCKLVKVIINDQKMYIAQITVKVVNVG